VSVMYFTCFII